MKNSFEVTFLGTNGSSNYNSGKRAKYGTNTLCIAVMAGEEVLIFDSGSGICGFDKLQDYQKEHIRLFYSHYHVDHFSGLLFFKQMFNQDKKFDLYGGSHGEKDFLTIVDMFLSPPLHPVGRNSLAAKLDFHEIGPDETIPVSKDVTVKTLKLSHPGGVLGYRAEYGGKAFCYCTDVELANHQNDAALLAFTQGADLLVLDSFFNDENVIPGWGHSSFKECAEWANYARVKKLALYHYGFTLTDTDIDTMEKKAQEIFPNTFAAADRMKVEL
jgi:phosphoribosyl 1,2-cyclic phosphodiesterase